MVAEVTVFPVPGGPWIRLSGLHGINLRIQALVRGADKAEGRSARRPWGLGPSCPRDR